MGRQVPSSLKALGRQALPTEIDFAGQCYSLNKVFKNDFFAVTAMYAGVNGKVILKVGRQASFLLLPMRWVGGLLARRERSALERLRDIDGVPRFLATLGKTGIVREYIEGHALTKGERVSDEFHGRLRGLVEAVHARDMAVVDLEKCENVLVGDDGRPYLFDFQISWYLRKGRRRAWPGRMVLNWFQRGDRYHLLKLQRRTRSDQMSAEQLAASYHKPWYVGLHTRATRPFTLVRRMILNRWDPRRTAGERGRVGE